VIEIPINQLKIVRSPLKSQATELLRDSIISGKISSGSKITERDIAERLGISRAPARDALLELEKEGLIETRANARYVIRLTEEEVRHLFEVRLSLELLAVELVTRNSNPKNRSDLSAALDELHSACLKQDRDAFHRSDFNFHRLIWYQANNPFLLRMLSYMLGPIFMLIANPIEVFDTQLSYAFHENLVNCINSGDVEAAKKSLVAHMDNSLQQRLKEIKTHPSY
jgi:DNA-binding GntR family transcriptional regulator